MGELNLGLSPRFNFEEEALALERDLPAELAEEERLRRLEREVEPSFEVESPREPSPLGGVDRTLSDEETVAPTRPISDLDISDLAQQGEQSQRDLELRIGPARLSPPSSSFGPKPLGLTEQEIELDKPPPGLKLEFEEALTFDLDPIEPAAEPSLAKRAQAMRKRRVPDPLRPPPKGIDKELFDHNFKSAISQGLEPEAARAQAIDALTPKPPKQQKDIDREAAQDREIQRRAANGLIPEPTRIFSAASPPAKEELLGMDRETEQEAIVAGVQPTQRLPSSDASLQLSRSLQELHQSEAFQAAGFDGRSEMQKEILDRDLVPQLTKRLEEQGLTGEALNRQRDAILARINAGLTLKAMRGTPTEVEFAKMVREEELRGMLEGMGRDRDELKELSVGLHEAMAIGRDQPRTAGFLDAMFHEQVIHFENLGMDREEAEAAAKAQLEMIGDPSFSEQAQGFYLDAIKGIVDLAKTVFSDAPQTLTALLNSDFGKEWFKKFDADAAAKLQELEDRKPGTLKRLEGTRLVVRDPDTGEWVWNPAILTSTVARSLPLGIGIGVLGFKFAKVLEKIPGKGRAARFIQRFSLALGIGGSNMLLVPTQEAGTLTVGLRKVYGAMKKKDGSAKFTEAEIDERLRRMRLKSFGWNLPVSFFTGTLGTGLGAQTLANAKGSLLKDVLKAIVFEFGFEAVEEGFQNVIDNAVTNTALEIKNGTIADWGTVEAMLLGFLTGPVQSAPSNILALAERARTKLHGHKTVRDAADRNRVETARAAGAVTPMRDEDSTPELDPTDVQLTAPPGEALGPDTPGIPPLPMEPEAPIDTSLEEQLPDTELELGIEPQPLFGDLPQFDFTQPDTDAQAEAAELVQQSVRIERDATLPDSEKVKQRALIADRLKQVRVSPKGSLADLEQSPEWRAADPRTQREMRGLFFDDFIVPGLELDPQEVGALRRAFMLGKEPTPETAPGKQEPIEVTAEPIIEPEKRVEPEKRAEPEKRVEPERKVEPERRTEPERKVEPEKRAEPERKVEPDRRVEPERAPEKKVEPDRRIEPERRTEPTRKPTEPRAELERRAEPERKPTEPERRKRFPTERPPGQPPSPLPDKDLAPPGEEPLKEPPPGEKPPKPQPAEEELGGRAEEEKGRKKKRFGVGRGGNRPHATFAALVADGEIASIDDARDYAVEALPSGPARKSFEDSLPSMLRQALSDKAGLPSFPSQGARDLNDAIAEEVAEDAGQVLPPSAIPGEPEAAAPLVGRLPQQTPQALADEARRAVPAPIDPLTGRAPLPDDPSFLVFRFASETEAKAFFDTADLSSEEAAAHRAPPDTQLKNPAAVTDEEVSAWTKEESAPILGPENDGILVFADEGMKRRGFADRNFVILGGTEAETGQRPPEPEPDTRTDLRKRVDEKVERDFQRERKDARDPDAIDKPSDIPEVDSPFERNQQRLSDENNQLTPLPPGARVVLHGDPERGGGGATITAETRFAGGDRQQKVVYDEPYQNSRVYWAPVGQWVLVPEQKTDLQQRARDLSRDREDAPQPKEPLERVPEASESLSDRAANLREPTPATLADIDPDAEATEILSVLRAQPRITPRMQKVVDRLQSLKQTRLADLPNEEVVDLLTFPWQKKGGGKPKLPKLIGSLVNAVGGREEVGLAAERAEEVPEKAETREAKRIRARESKLADEATAAAVIPDAEAEEIASRFIKRIGPEGVATIKSLRRLLNLEEGATESDVERLLAIEFQEKSKLGGPKKPRKRIIKRLQVGETKDTQRDEVNREMEKFMNRGGHIRHLEAGIAAGASRGPTARHRKQGPIDPDAFIVTGLSKRKSSLYEGKFFSALESVLAQDPIIRQSKTAGEMLKRLATLTTKDPKFRPEEIEWSGIADWLRELEPSAAVSHEDMITFIQHNRIDVQDVVFGDGVPTHPVIDKAKKRAEKAANEFDTARRSHKSILEALGMGPAADARSIEHMDATIREMRAGTFKAQFVSVASEAVLQRAARTQALAFRAQATIDQTNLMLKAVGTPRANSAWKTIARAAKRATNTANLQYRLTGRLTPRWRDASLPIPGQYREILLTVPSIKPQFKTRIHWGEIPNVLAHIRLTRMPNVDDPSRKTLIVQEIQSDWHMRGKNFGTTIEGTPATLGRPSEEISAERVKFSAMIAKLISDARERPGAKEITNEIEILEEQLEDISPVPDVPFRNTWSDLAMKRVLQMAAEDPAVTHVAWFGMEQQKDLRKSGDPSGKSDPLYRAVYEKAIPNFMKKFGKKYGATLTEIVAEEDPTPPFESTPIQRQEDIPFDEMPEAFDALEVIPSAEGGFVVYDHDTDMELAGPFDTRAEAESAASDLAAGIPVQRILGDTQRHVLKAIPITNEMREAVLGGRALSLSRRAAPGKHRLRGQLRKMRRNAEVLLGDDKKIVEVARYLRHGEEEVAGKIGLRPDKEGILRSVIQVAMDIGDPVSTLNHEAAHHVFDHFLSGPANKILDKTFGKGTKATQQLAEILRAEGNNEAAIEVEASLKESKAYGFELFVNGKFNPRGLSQNIFGRLLDKLRRLGNWLRGETFADAADVFAFVASGQAARRAPRAPLDPEAVSLSRRLSPREHAARKADEKATKDAARPTKERTTTPAPKDVVDAVREAFEQGGGRVSDLNLKAFRSEEMMQAALDLIENNDGFRKYFEDQRGSLTDAEYEAGVKKILAHPEKLWARLKKLNPGERLGTTIEDGAALVMFQRSYPDMVKAAEGALEDGGSEALLDYYFSQARFAFLRGKVGGIVADPGRALRLLGKVNRTIGNAKDVLKTLDNLQVGMDSRTALQAHARGFLDAHKKGGRDKGKQFQLRQNALMSYFTENMINGLSTLDLNIVENALNLGFHMASTLGVPGFTGALSLRNLFRRASNPDKIFLREFIAELSGATRGWFAMWPRIIQTYRLGESPSGAARLDEIGKLAGPERFTDKGVGGKLWQVYKLFGRTSIMAVDEAFRTINYEMRKSQLAAREILSKGGGMKAYIEALGRAGDGTRAFTETRKGLKKEGIANSLERFLRGEEARESAELKIFSQADILGAEAFARRQAFASQPEGTIANIILEWKANHPVPSIFLGLWFVRTLAVVYETGLRSTFVARIPWLGLRSVQDAMAAARKPDATDAQKREAAEIRARMDLGNTIVGIASLMASAGVITGGGPPPFDPRRAAWLAQNRPYSINLGRLEFYLTGKRPKKDHFIDLTRMGSAGMLLTIPAMIADTTHYGILNPAPDRRGDEASVMFARAVMGFGEGFYRTILDKQWVGGVVDAMKALGADTSESMVNRYAQSLIRGFTPGGRAASQFFDERGKIIRESWKTLDGLNKGVFGSGKSEFIGVKGLGLFGRAAPKIGLMGEVLTREAITFGGTRLEKSLSRIATPAPVIAIRRVPAFRRLMKAGIGIRPPTRKSKPVPKQRGERQNWTPKQFAVYSQLHGRERIKLYQSQITAKPQRWNRLDRSARKRLHRKIMRRVSGVALRGTLKLMKAQQINATVRRMTKSRG